MTVIDKMLKPCPFCGYEKPFIKPVPKDKEYIGRSIKCPNCDIVVQIPFGDDLTARDEYNKRNGFIKCTTPTECKPVVRGRWVYSDEIWYMPQCTNCGAHPFKGYIPSVEEVSRTYKFCPNCGAEMI